MKGTLQDYLDANGYNFTKDGKCIGCGECCSRLLPLTSEDVKRIKQYLKHHKIKRFAKEPDCVDMTCPFLDREKQNNKCQIYEARPEICRQFICCKQRKECTIPMGEARTTDLCFMFYGETDLMNTLIGGNL